MKRWKKAILIILFVAAMLFLLDTGCIVRNITGFPCPGCGMIRAHKAALQLDFSAAFFYHPLWFTAIPLILLTIFRPNGIFSAKKKNDIFWCCCALLFLVVYIIRMILYFPNTAPMDYNPHSIFSWIFHK
ncbi:MAG: DUF2752 domain-containing protein [Oscillospiraceae bacterium]